jgi:(p)ppGpp synthase/HD superfamily hydrolase
MNPYAQTNIQLFEQLLELGHSQSDLQRLRSSYELSSQLVSAQFRANGKPEITHLTGVASILAKHRAGLPVILAGLLHNAYISGDFGSFWPDRMTPRKRRILRGVIGDEAERLVARYSVTHWDPQRTASLAEATPAASDEERGILLIRLANELEEAADLLGDHPARRQRKFAQLGDYAAIARNIGLPALADELQERQAFLQGRQTSEMPAASHGDTYAAPPLSYRRRLKPAISHALIKLWLRCPAALRTGFRNWADRRTLRR